MKIAVISDTHFGARNDSHVILKHQEKFYNELFWPKIEELGINTIIHCGDLFDRRKYINFVTLHEANKMFIDKLDYYSCLMYIIPGNHDIYYKNTLDISSTLELYRDSSYVQYMDRPMVDIIDGVPLAFIPWICDENHEEVMQFVRDCKADIAFAHLELLGFEMNKGQYMDHGMNPALFRKFERVYTGHYHHPSVQGNITYLGSPYEMNWSDYNSPKGFFIFDTESKAMERVDNPNHIFKKILYDDTFMDLTELVDYTFDEYKDSYVKVIIQNRENSLLLDTVVNKLEHAAAADVQVVDDHKNDDALDEQDIIDEAEDTITILTNAVSTLETPLKSELTNYLRDLYSEALQVE